MKQQQISKDLTQWDYGYIEYFKKAMENQPDPDKKSKLFHRIKYNEALRDFHVGPLRHINHLIQIDGKPNLELKEQRCEIYKISLSFRNHSKYASL